MIRVGLTGSIGMGKSAVSAMFRRAGVPVFDADAAVHELQGPGGRLVPVIESHFPGTTGPLGVDRQKLGAAVLGDAPALRRLEAIVHPAVGRMRTRWLLRNRARPMVVLDIPLLFEKRGWKSVDTIVVVSAPVWVQRKRVLARPGMTAAKFRRILALQTPDHVKRSRADHVIETGHLRHETERQVRRLVACLARKRGR
jgi:dephospho-CoA kinase